MYTQEDYAFKEKIDNTIEKYAKIGYGCGCLTGVLIAIGVVAYFVTPTVNLNELGKKWQSEQSEQPQKVKSSKRKVYPIIKSNQRY